MEDFHAKSNCTKTKTNEQIERDDEKNDMNKDKNRS